MYWILQKIIEAYFLILACLIELMKKAIPYEWIENRHRAFLLLEDKLINAPILVPPDWKKTFHVDVDVSKFCIGLVLSQEYNQKKDHPIYYASRQLNPAKKNYSTTKREALGIVYACKKF
jgi:hypothetical protein